MQQGVIERLSSAFMGAVSFLGIGYADNLRKKRADAENEFAEFCRFVVAKVS